MSLRPKPGVPGTFIDDQGREIKIVDMREGTQADVDRYISGGDPCGAPCGENVKCNQRRGHAGQHVYWRAGFGF